MKIEIDLWNQFQFLTKQRQLKRLLQLQIFLFLFEFV